MASPSQPQPTWTNAGASSRELKRLALTSFLLSLVPVVAFALYLLSVSFLWPLSDFDLGVGPVSIKVGHSVFVWVSAVLYVGGLISSIGGMAIGNRALRRAERYPQQPTGTGFATAGVVLGSVYVGLAAVTAASALLSYYSLQGVGPYGK
jgi:hypothetical protein